MAGRSHPCPDQLVSFLCMPAYMNEEIAPMDSSSLELQKRDYQAVRSFMKQAGRQAEYGTSRFLSVTNHMSGPVWSDI